MADPIELNIRGVQQLVGSKVNKINSAMDGGEGVDAETEDAFTLKLSDQELLELAQLWTNKYLGYEGKISKRQKANETYYLGKQKEGSSEATGGDPISANLLFEAVETFLPAALAKNPEPVVWSDNSQQGNSIAGMVKTMLQFHADTLVLRRKLAQGTRNWTVDLLGVWKHGWDDTVSDISLEVRDAKNFIFDPEGYIDSYGDYVGYLGERIKVTAEKLITLFPKHKAYITIKAGGKMGTEVTYTEWWNDDYCFYTFMDVVLDKNKNPHFNYPTEAPEVNELGKPMIDMEGQPVMTEVKGNNHFAIPKKPYTFLSVFSFGDRPHDVTGLIEQNIPNQRRISRRTEQIDYNLTRANNSTAFSENNYNQETAKQASKAMALGHPVLVPSGGPIADAMHQFPAQGLDGAFFNAQQQDMAMLRSIFGTQGITAQQQDEDQTARGMILNNQYDNSRIGGGIGDAIEQVAKNIFNYQVQLYKVYYDTPHFASVMGQMKATEYIELTSQMITAHLVVSVSPDSMKPHDEVTEMNQALSLWEAKALDIKTLLTKLNFPDPQNTAAQVWLYQTNPALYGQLNFPELTQQIQNLMAVQQAQQPQGAPPQGPPVGPNAEAQSEPPQPISVPPAGSSLTEVPLPKI